MAVGMIGVPLYGKLARGRVAWISENRYDQVMVYRWNVQERVRADGSRRDGPYAITNTRLADGRRVKIFMHVLIMGCTGIDHRNGYGLDCTDPNLRKATEGENQHNQGSHTGSTSAYKGVYWHCQRKKWRAEISVNRVKHRLGSFNNEAEAARAYDAAAIEFHGDFAYLNFPAETR